MSLEYMLGYSTGALWSFIVAVLVLQFARGANAMTCILVLAAHAFISIVVKGILSP